MKETLQDCLATNRPHLFTKTSHLIATRALEQGINKLLHVETGKSRYVKERADKSNFTKLTERPTHPVAAAGGGTVWLIADRT